LGDEKEIKHETINNLGGLYFWLLPKDNVLLVSKDNISAKLLNSFARAKSVKVGRNLPNGLDVEVKERINTALSCKGEVCAYIDEDGFVFERAIAFDDKEFLKFFDEREAMFDDVLEVIREKNPIVVHYFFDILKELSALGNFILILKNIIDLARIGKAGAVLDILLILCFRIIAHLTREIIAYL